MIISCQSDKKKPKTHNPKSEISQILKNENAQVLFDKASEKINIQQYDSARILLKKSLDYEKSPIIYNEIGITFLLEKKIEYAINYYEKSIETDSTYYSSYINLSRCYLIINDHQKGKQLLINMISNCNSEYWKAYGNMYLALFYFNGDKDCQKAKLTLMKADILEYDPELGKQYTDFMDNINRTCQ